MPIRLLPTTGLRMKCTHGLKSVVLFALLMAFSCNSDSQKSSPTNATYSKAQLLFFVNPTGRPCIMQQEILDSIHENIDPIVDVKQISTANPSDRQFFYDHGVRSLPLIILIDKKGNVVKRFTPGIQDSSYLLNIITSCDC